MKPYTLSPRTILNLDLVSHIYLESGNTITIIMASGDSFTVSGTHVGNILAALGMKAKEPIEQKPKDTTGKPRVKP